MKTFFSLHLLISSFLFVCLFLTACASSNLVNFGSGYVSTNKGTHSIEIPEVQELVHIVIALTETGRNDENMVDRTSSYYREVMATFGNFKNEAVVRDMDALMRSGILRGSRYAHVKMDACGFYFDGDRLIKDSIYPQLNWNNENYVTPILRGLEDFAQKTNFRRFYAMKKPYYEELKALAEMQMPIQRQWKWLEERFPTRYDHYRITFSPLAYGNHSTNNFESNGFRQTVMFIAAPFEKNSPLTDSIKEGLMTRVVFTEIDHNYVNPMSTTFLNKIEPIFSNRSKWVASSVDGSYNNAYRVFNEYMTWAVFTLYAYQRFNTKDFEEINARTERQMAQLRGFVKYREFNQKLLAIFKQNPLLPMTEIYPQILEWAAKQ